MEIHMKVLKNLCKRNIKNLVPLLLFGNPRKLEVKVLKKI